MFCGGVARSQVSLFHFVILICCDTNTDRHSLMSAQAWGRWQHPQGFGSCARTVSFLWRSFQPAELMVTTYQTRRCIEYLQNSFDTVTHWYRIDSQTYCTAQQGVWRSTLKVTFCRAETQFFHVELICGCCCAVRMKLCKLVTVSTRFGLFWRLFSPACHVFIRAATWAAVKDTLKMNVLGFVFLFCFL